MLKIIVLFVSFLSTVFSLDQQTTLFTNPSKVDSDVLNVEKSLDEVKSLLNQLDSNRFKDLTKIVNKVQSDLKDAKRQFDVDNDFDKLTARVQDLKDELNRFAPKFKDDLEDFWRKQ